MALFFTSNRLTTDATAVVPGELLDALSVKAWAGQAGEPASFRIGNSGTEDASLPLYSTSLSIELSSDRRYWGPAVNYAVAAGAVGDTVYVRCLATIDETETEDVAYIVADADRLRIDFYLAPVNELDGYYSQAHKYEGDNTREVRQFFETDGEAVRIIEYEPLPKPDNPPTNPTTLATLNNYSIREWVNPMNQLVGFRMHEWYTRAFVGDQQILMNAAYNLKELQLSFGDTNAILLPHDFEGFNPSPRKTLLPISLIALDQWAYSGTVFTILRDDTEFALRNIRRAGFFKGQILFWYADLVRIHYPGGSSTDGFLPWNELLNNEWKPISYVPEWSTSIVEDAYDPYCESFI